MSENARSVTIGDVRLGGGRPAIIVSITGDTPERLRAQHGALTGHPVDIVEWRLDHFAQLHDTDAVIAMAAALADGPLPLLATCRTRAEGGVADIGDAEYARILLALIATRAPHAIDVEYERDGAADIIEAARAAAVPVIASHHDFSRTPARDELITHLEAMQASGADIVKLAVMPQSSADVITLLDVTRAWHDSESHAPAITIAMGRLGAITRVAGGHFGSVATFAALGAASAPGQLDVDRLRDALDLLDMQTD